MKRQTIDLSRCILDLSGKGDRRNFLTLNNCLQNTFILGATGSSKTTSSGAALAGGLLNVRGLKPHEKVGMVVYLFKDDRKEWERWAYLQGRENDIIRIGAEHKNVFNPLLAYAKDEPMNAVNMMMNLSGLTSGGGTRKKGEDFWETAQRTRLDRLIRLNQISGEPLSINTLYRLHSSAPNNPDQATSEEFVQNSYFLQMMGRAVEQVGENHPDFLLVERYLTEFINLNDRTSSSILAMTSAILEPFISSRILNNLFCGGSTLKLEEIFSGKILLLDIPVQRHKMVGRIAQILLGFAIKEEVQRRDLTRYGNPLIFWKDECTNFIIPRTDSLFMSVSRSARCGTVLINQNTSNMLATIGGEGRAAEAQVNSILALCNTKVFHANNDYISNEYASKTIGKAFINLSSYSNGRQTGDSASTSKALHFLVEPRVFAARLRTGGQSNDFISDVIVTSTGRIFSNGQNYLKTSFKQYFAV